MSFRLVAAGLVAAQVAGLIVAAPRHSVLHVVLSSAGLGAIAVLGRSTAFPVLGMGVMFVGLELAGEEPLGPLPLVGLWIVGVVAGRRNRLALYGALIAAVGAAILVFQTPADLAFVLPAMFLPPVLLGWTIGRRADQLAQLEAVYAELAAERERAEALAAAAERARIARDSHAVLSAAVAGMVERARAAVPLIETDPRAATVAFADLHAAGAEAAAELRRLLGLARAPD